MTRRQLTRVHGYSIVELEYLLLDSCSLFDSDVSLEHEALGGWSNINIHGNSAEIDFVLKLPWYISHQRTNPYNIPHDICLYLNKLGIAPKPLSVGRFSDSKEIPFLILEYVEGIIHESLIDFSVNEISSLKECLQVLCRQNPPGLRKYRSQSDHLIITHALVENHESLSGCAQDVAKLIGSFNEIYPAVLSFTESFGAWPSTFMHGDLWVPNIVFQSGNVILLDFEACAYGNHLYDLSYLLESPINTILEIPSGLLLPEDIEEVNNLRPLALAFLIEWSFERVLSMDAGLVEPNLVTPESRSALLGYIRSKILRLKTILS